MATNGVLIDYKNPEKYYCLRFGYVKRIKYLEASKDEDASLLVFFRKHEVSYTTDGFFNLGKNPSPSFDLLLVKDMEKIPYGDRKRKVVQISATNVASEYYASIYALCDDGTIFASCNTGWEKLPEIPQD
jgi:hypothetical protein